MTWLISVILTGLGWGYIICNAANIEYSWMVYAMTFFTIVLTIYHFNLSIEGKERKNND